jgi:hypothetical protein
MLKLSLAQLIRFLVEDTMLDSHSRFLVALMESAGNYLLRKSRSYEIFSLHISKKYIIFSS